MHNPRRQKDVARGTALLYVYIYICTTLVGRKTRDLARGTALTFPTPTQEFVTMFSKRITATRRRSTVLVFGPQTPKSPLDRLASVHGPAHGLPSDARQSQKFMSAGDLEPAEVSMLRQLMESNWSLGDAFRALDPHGEGSIPTAELRPRLRDLGIELSFNELQGILAKVDANNDGSISFSEFVSRYRLQPLMSSQEAKSDLVMAISSQYKSPMQAFQAACGGHAHLTRGRLKGFIRSLGLGLADSAIDQLCADVDQLDQQSTNDDASSSSSFDRVASSSSRTAPSASDRVSFVDFLRMIKTDSSLLSKSGLWRDTFGPAAARMHSNRSDSQGVLLSQLEEALRERMRAAYGTLKTAFAAIDKDRNGMITRKELREAFTMPPLNLGFDAETINAIIGARFSKVRSLEWVCILCMQQIHLFCIQQIHIFCMQHIRRGLSPSPCLTCILGGKMGTDVGECVA